MMSILYQLNKSEIKYYLYVYEHETFQKSNF